MKFECDPQFDLVGNPVLLCKTGGQWSGAAPVCQSKYPAYNGFLVTRLTSSLTSFDNYFFRKYEYIRLNIQLNCFNDFLQIFDKIG